MQAQRTVGQVEFVIKQHLVKRRRIAQVFLFEFLSVGIQGLVALHRMTLWVTLAQVIAQLLARNQLAHLLLQGLGVSLEVFENSHGRQRTA